MQVYDHNTRIPLLVHTPAGFNSTVHGEASFPASMVDLAPTILELAAGTGGGNGGGAGDSAAASMDGISFAKQLQDRTTWSQWPRTTSLVEYQSLTGGPHARAMSCAERADACVLRVAP